jgi:hypothetical protein
LGIADIGKLVHVGGLVVLEGLVKLL